MGLCDGTKLATPYYMTIASAVPGIAPTPPQPVALTPTTTPSSSGLSFGDILDTINPLQHIPILSGLYRAATGSQISPGAQIAGDTLYGALLPGGAIAGFASSVANVAVQEATGSDISQHVVNTLTASTTTQTPAATTLIPSAQPVQAAAVATTPSLPATPLLRSNHPSHSSNAQYQRAQAFDALNSKLVKMAV